MINAIIFAFINFLKFKLFLLIIQNIKENKAAIINEIIIIEGYCLRGKPRSHHCCDGPKQPGSEQPLYLKIKSFNDIV